MEDARVGAAFRAVRIRRGLRQADVAARARVSRATVGRVERGHLDTLSLATLRRMASALEIRVDVQPRWRAGDLDRLLNARHSGLHEVVASMFATELPGWVLAPEVSFAVFGERGVIDIVAWHPERRELLIIELKTDISDVNELVGTVDRKRRLATRVARDRGWDPIEVGVWVIVADGRTNRRRIDAHRTMLRAAFPSDGRAIRSWLLGATRRGPIAALSMWIPDGADDHPGRRSGGAGRVPVRRVRVAHKE